MSNSQEKSWSGGPNAPEIPYYLYFEEKASFSGLLVSSILYGACKAPLPIRLTARVHPIRSVYSRDDRRAVLPMYGRAAQLRPS